MDQTPMAEVLTTTASDVVSTTPTETTTEASTTDSVASETTATETKSETSVESEKPSREQSGLIRAVQAERQKRQALEAQLQQLQTQGSQSYAADPYVDPAQAIQGVKQEVRGVMTSMSEAWARQTYPDYQEKFAAFEEAVSQSPALLDSVLASELPGQAAYIAGKEHLFRKRYGTTHEEILANHEKELRPKIEAEVEKKILSKLKGKNQQPTNILNARAATGDSSPGWRPSTWGEALSKRR